MKYDRWVLTAIEQALDRIPEDLTGKATVVLEMNLNQGGVGSLIVEPKWRAEVRPPLRPAINGRT